MSALIVVDMQLDFCEGGALAVPGGKKIDRDIYIYAMDHMRDYEAVVFTKDWHNAPPDTNGGHFGDPPDYVNTWPVHCVGNSTGAMFAKFTEQLSVVGPLAGHNVFYKGQGTPDYSGFQGRNTQGQPLHSFLREMGVLEVDVCGLAADYCVRETALSAKALMYEVNVLSDLTAGIAPDAIEKTLRMVRS